jgi:hypothetical protein
LRVTFRISSTLGRGIQCINLSMKALDSEATALIKGIQTIALMTFFTFITAIIALVITTNTVTTAASHCYRYPSRHISTCCPHVRSSKFGLGAAAAEVKIEYLCCMTLSILNHNHSTMMMMVPNNCCPIKSSHIITVNHFTLQIVGQSCCA